MADRLGEAVLELRTDDSKYYSGIDRAKGGAQGLEKSFLNTAAQLSLIGTAVLRIFQQIGRGFGDLSNAYAKQIDAESKRNQILKTTGNVVNKTTTELNKMASEMQRLTGIGDEVIINAQAIMLTFKQIGEEVFPRAVEAALDVSRAFDIDLKSATTMVGKALENIPTAWGALRRVGVTFSKEVEEMGNALWEMGKKAEAQQLLLKGIEDQVKGVAEAMGNTAVGKIRKFGAAMGDMKEKLGRVVTEMMAPLAEGMTDFLTKNKGKIYAIFKELPAIVGVIGKYLPTILEESLTGGQFQNIIADMVALLITGFKVAVSTFTILLGAAIASIPDLFVATMSSIGSIIEMSLAKTMSPELLLPKMSRIEFGQYVAKEEGTRLSGDKLTKEYEKYTKLWEEHNKFMQETNEATGKSIKKIMANADLALGDMGKVISSALTETKKHLSDMGEQFKDIAETDTFKKMTDELNNLINSVEKTGEAFEEVVPQIVDSIESISGISEIPGAARSYVGLGYTPYQGTDQEIPGTSPAMMAIADFAAKLGNAIRSIENLSAVLNPLQTIFDSFMKTLEPVINGVLQPLVGMLRILGQALAQMVVPIILRLVPVIDLLSQAFVWLYNKAIMPIANLIIVILGTISNVFIKIINVIIDIINMFKRASKEIAHVSTIDVQAQKLQAIEMEDLMNAGVAGGTVIGAGATYQQARPITVTLDIHDNDVYGGSLHEFAIMLRNEFEALEVLNL